MIRVLVLSLIGTACFAALVAMLFSARHEARTLRAYVAYLEARLARREPSDTERAESMADADDRARDARKHGDVVRDAV